MKMKIMIHEGKIQEAIKIYEGLSKELKWPMRALRSIKNLSSLGEEAKGIAEGFYVS